MHLQQNFQLGTLETEEVDLLGINGPSLNLGQNFNCTSDTDLLDLSDFDPQIEPNHQECGPQYCHALDGPSLDVNQISDETGTLDLLAN